MNSLHLLKNRSLRLLLLAAIPTLLFLALKAQLSWRPVVIGQHTSMGQGVQLAPGGQGSAVPAPVSSIAVSPNGQHIASSDTSGDVRIWDIAGRELFRHLPGARQKQIAGNGDHHSLAFLPDGSALVTGNWNFARQQGRLQLWDVASGKLLRTIPKIRSMATTLAISPDGSALATAGFTETAEVWDARSGRLLHTLPSRMSPATARDIRVSRAQKLSPLLMPIQVVGIAFSPDGNTIAGGCSEETGTGFAGRVNLWDRQSGRLLRTLSGHSDRVSAVAFAPRKPLLASSAEDGSVAVWNLVTGKLLYPMLRHNEMTHSLAFSPDGTLLATGSEMAVQLCNVATGKTLRTLTDKEGINTFAFSPDGSMIATGGFKGTVRMWRVK